MDFELLLNLEWLLFCFWFVLLIKKFTVALSDILNSFLLLLKMMLSGETELKEAGKGNE